MGEMKIETTRFGNIECPETEVIHFSRGMIGFPDERDFVVLSHGESNRIAWLQSVTTPGVSFPVVSAHVFAGYPDVSLERHLASVGLAAEGDEYAVMAVLSALPGQPATVNLLAPVIVDTRTRRGAQVILEGSRFSARELFLVSDDERQVTPVEPAETLASNDVAVGDTGAPQLG